MCYISLARTRSRRLFEIVGGNMTKLVIYNETAWSTRELRSVFLKVINENIKFEGPLRHTIQATIVYTRRGGMSGYAYYHSGRMRLRLPKPSPNCWWCDGRKTRDQGWPRDDGKEGRMFLSNKRNPAPCNECNGTGKGTDQLKLDVRKLAHLFEHELAHCRGYKHKGMCGLNGWKVREDDYKYLDGLSVNARISKPKTIVDKKQERYKRVLARITAWEAKAKRARNALKKLEATKRYYERTNAA